MLCMFESNQKSGLSTNTAFMQSDTLPSLTCHCLYHKCTTCMPRNYCGEHTTCRKCYKSLHCKSPGDNSFKSEKVSDIFHNIKEDNNIEHTSLAVVEFSQQTLLNGRKDRNRVMSTWQQGKLFSSLRQSLFGPHHVSSAKPKIIFGGTYPIDKPLSFR